MRKIVTAATDTAEVPLSRSTRVARTALPLVLSLCLLSGVASVLLFALQAFGGMLTGQPPRFGFWPLTAQEQRWPWFVVSSLPVLVGLSGLMLAGSRRGLRGLVRGAPTPVAVTVVGLVVFVVGVILRDDVLAWSGVAWTLTGAVVMVAGRPRWPPLVVGLCGAQVAVIAVATGSPLVWGGGPRTLAARSYELASVALSPDGRHLATVTGFGDLELDDLTTGAVSHRRLDQGSGWVRFSADGRRLWVFTYASNSYTWDVATGAWESTRFNTADGVYTAALASDGAVVTVPFGADVTLRGLTATSVTTKRLPSLRPTAQVATVVAAGVSADGRLVAVGYDDGEVVVTRVAKDSRLLALPAAPEGGATVWVPYRRVRAGAVSAVAVAPDGQTLAVATVDGRIRVVDVAGGTTRTELERPLLSGYVGRALSLEFSPDGRRLLAGYLSGAVQLWTLGT